MTRMYGGVHMSQNPKLVKKSIKMLTKKLKKKKVVKALRGALIKKGTKLSLSIGNQEVSPALQEEEDILFLNIKTKKIRKTPELSSVGVTKIAANNLRKLSVAEAIKR